jgi:hypothetical protein
MLAPGCREWRRAGMMLETKPGDAATTAREAEADRVCDLRNALNREMMSLPATERRRRWIEYLIRLDDLTKSLWLRPPSRFRLDLAQFGAAICDGIFPDAGERRGRSVLTIAFVWHALVASQSIGGTAMAELMGMAKKHRERAEELRGLAMVVTNAEQKTILLSIAANYDQLARTIERAATFKRAEAGR